MRMRMTMNSLLDTAATYALLLPSWLLALSMLPWPNYNWTFCAHLLDRRSLENIFSVWKIIFCGKLPSKTKQRELWLMEARERSLVRFHNAKFKCKHTKFITAVLNLARKEASSIVGWHFQCLRDTRWITIVFERTTEEAHEGERRALTSGGCGLTDNNRLGE